ncbi:MAG TPA: SMP-30/gluconolactonase/LRE family protein [Ktedonobacteraceae bacterium]|nr:SMP-30/gluconolactonase/LRE family protein [Ktedonobacteraceae bacterium]
MLARRTSVICPIIFFCCILLASCGGSAAPSAAATPRASPTRIATPTSTPVPTATSTTGLAPQHYNSRVFYRGSARPDDLAFDQEGRLLFGDFYNGTISQVNSDGTVTVIARGLAGPEGFTVLSNGTMIIAEQRRHRIVSLAPGATSPTVLRALPGTPSTARCKDGVDGTAYDATTNTLIVPDSPTGAVYRMSLDGRTLTLLTSGMVRPVGGVVDAQGNMYIADECGGEVWKIAPGGKVQRFGGFSMPDDVALDAYGNLFVIDLDPAIHALIRLNLATGQRETLASRGYIEPQGLVIDQHGNIFVSDDFANIIVEYMPA